jgi:hypothetical protein
MTPSRLGALALAALLALTALTFWLSEDGAPALAIGVVSAAKALVIGAVFLDLRHAGWAVRLAAAAVVLGVAVGAALLLRS